MSAHLKWMLTKFIQADRTQTEGCSLAERVDQPNQKLKQDIINCSIDSVCSSIDIFSLCFMSDEATGHQNSTDRRLPVNEFTITDSLHSSIFDRRQYPFGVTVIDSQSRMIRFQLAIQMVDNISIDFRQTFTSAKSFNFLVNFTNSRGVCSVR